MPSQLINSAIGALPEKSPDGLPAFLKSFFTGLSKDDLDLLDPVTMARTARIHWDLAGKLKKNDSIIKIHTPCLDGEDWCINRTVIDIVSDDMAFLVDSIVAEINRHEFLIHYLVHPLIEGHSHIHIQLQSTVTETLAEKLEDRLSLIIHDIELANRDWRDMLAHMKRACGELDRAPAKYAPEDIHEAVAFIDYLHQNNFTLLGYKKFSYSGTGKNIKSRAVTGSGLGLLDTSRKPPLLNGEIFPEYPQTADDSLITVSKTARKSTVHRPVPMDVIAVKTFDDKGKINGEKIFLGLFTSVTYSRSVSDVPYLRQKVERTIEQSGFPPNSHDGRALRHILEKYPRDDFFQTSVEDLVPVATSILHLQERQRIALYPRNDRLNRYVSCLVYVPRERYDTRIRLRLQKILEEEMKGACTNFYTTLDDSVFARVIYIIHPDSGKVGKYDAQDIQEKLQQAGRSWSERLGDVLAREHGRSERTTSTRIKYADAFPVAYRERYEAKQGVHDIVKIEQVLETGRLALDLYKPRDCEGLRLRLKIFHPDHPVNLSDVLPLLENMGLQVLSELPYEVKPGGTDKKVWVHDFLMESTGVDCPIIVRDVKDVFEEALEKVWTGEMENDGLNRLVICAKMTWREITILRTYVRYMRQIRYPFSRTYIEKALTDHPKISKLAVSLFKAWNDPEHGDQAEMHAAGCGIAIDHELENVPSLDQDRILRTLCELIEATLRTNYFQPDEHGQPKTYLSVKLDSRAIHDLPEPKPFREIFVYAPRVEGIHLRGDRIARGGIRWSDRPEDFRTEVLGLMKAQMVKNAVIVPMGAKGGFVVKQPPAEGGRKAFMEEGIECYKTFICGLLDLTDNQIGKRIAPPKNVARRDGDDPYLVVAADKGTASFSDIANTLSHNYGFWLADAFASGGSTGYDHKKMGITARGAWESVKRHFRELNHDTQSQSFDVIGVGDMSGDVFGNGMLLSKHIRMVGAFNHLHIVCDPNPDPDASFKERQRLFKAVKGWDAYDENKLSRGGKIYSRADKSLKLTPEIMERFNVEREVVTPHELIKSILKARTDLLWFGGIGTYIKGSKESHADVGDKANEPLRINAADLKAKVIGEGANLAITQAGRIEFAEKGGRVNTDFIDNSGGVDSSDHEVNIKILLNTVTSSKKHKLSMGTRNRLLEQMTEEVAEHVLRTNYQQTQALSLAELDASASLQIHAEFIEDLERNISLNRALEGLPDEETIETRLRAGKGLTRPELCVLLAYAKITFTKDLLASDIPDAPDMTGWLMEYFPQPLQDKYEKEIKAHRLHREIIAMALANSVVNRMGPTFVKAGMIKTGASCAEVARAYIIVREVFGLSDLWSAIESLDASVPAHLQLKGLRDINTLAETAVNWFLTRLARDLDIKKDTEAFRAGIEDLESRLGDLVTPGLKETIRQRMDASIRDGLPEATARKIAILPVLGSACDIIRIGIENKTDPGLAARIYFVLGEHFEMNWLRQQARFMHADDRWTAEALDGLTDQLYSCQAGLTVRILQDMKNTKYPATFVPEWLKNHAHQTQQLESLIQTMRAHGTLDLPMLMIAEQRLRGLYGG